ncbi:unnamed protein product, partial [Discosporangium mesarthrocarpum]
PVSLLPSSQGQSRVIGGDMAVENKDENGANGGDGRSESSRNGGDKKTFKMSLPSKTKSKYIAGKPGSGRGKTTERSIAIGEQGSIEGKDKDYVTGIGEGEVVSANQAPVKGPLVIPLAVNSWAIKAVAAPARTGDSPGKSTTAALEPGEGPPATEKRSLDELAAEALVRESRELDGRSAREQGTDFGTGSDRVIALTGAESKDGQRKGTLLARSMMPGLAELEGDDAKFKYDLTHRADDVDVKSDAYRVIPIEEFGAALLRGMGWTGPKVGEGDEKDRLKDVEPRHHRLGLGAQPKPPEERETKQKLKPGEKPRVLEEERRELWRKKAAAAVAGGGARPLVVADVVTIGGGEHRGKRAMVLKTQGVPGLNKISVRLEEGGEEAIVDRPRLSKVQEDELARHPFLIKRGEGGRATTATGSAAGLEGTPRGQGGDG